MVRLTLALATALIACAAATASPQSTASPPADKTKPDARAQTGAKAQPDTGPQAKQPKIDLLDLAPADTEAAARRAAEAMAAKDAKRAAQSKHAANTADPSAQKDDPTGQKTGADTSPDAGGVTELHVASPGSQTAVADSKDGSVTHKQGGAKVHGSVYGSADPKHPATRTDGAEVGVTSKSGKTSVDVGTGQTRGAPPQ